MKKLINFFEKKANGKIVFIFFLTFLFIQVVVLTIGFPHLSIYSKQQPLDLRFTYSAQGVFDYLYTLSAKGRIAYRFVHLLDFIFIISYSSFYTLLLIYLFHKNKWNFSFIYKLRYIALLTALADLLENGSILILNLFYPVKNNILATGACLFTCLKWSFAFTAYFLIIAGFIALGLKLLLKKLNK